MVRPARGPLFQVFFYHFFDPPARTVPRQRPTSRVGGILVDSAGYAPEEGGAGWVGPLGVPTFHKGGSVGTLEGLYTEVWLDLGYELMDPMPQPCS